MYFLFWGVIFFDFIPLRQNCPLEIVQVSAKVITYTQIQTFPFKRLLIVGLLPRLCLVFYEKHPIFNRNHQVGRTRSCTRFGKMRPIFACRLVGATENNLVREGFPKPFNGFALNFVFRAGVAFFFLS